MTREPTGGERAKPDASEQAPTFGESEEATSPDSFRWLRPPRSESITPLAPTPEGWVDDLPALVPGRGKSGETVPASRIDLAVSDDAEATATSSAVPLARHGLNRGPRNADEALVLALVDGKASCSEIVAASFLSRARAAVALSALARRGVVYIDPRVE
jgi:hypothetical protein